MAAKQRAVSRARRSNPTLVILEDIRAQNTAVIEAVHALSDRMGRSLAELRAELSERIERLEAAVRQNSEDIRRLDAEVRALKAEVGTLVTRAAFVALEGRVEALERKVGR